MDDVEIENIRSLIEHLKTLPKLDFQRAAERLFAEVLRLRAVIATKEVEA